MTAIATPTLGAVAVGSRRAGPSDSPGVARRQTPFPVLGAAVGTPGTPHYLQELV